MPSSTFSNLPHEKKERVEHALLEEFSRAPLSQAQVSNIVESAHIARGAFYRYFDDLTDAYRYMLAQALRALHHGLPHSSEQAATASSKQTASSANEQATSISEQAAASSNEQAATSSNEQTTSSINEQAANRADNLEKLASQAYRQARLFVEQAQQSQYYQLMYWYYHENNMSFVPSSFQPEESAEVWAVATLSHVAIRECLLDRANVPTYLERLREALEKLAGTQLEA